MATQPPLDPDRVQAGLRDALARSRATTLAGELARELYPGLRRSRERMLAEDVLQPALLRLAERGLLRWP